MATEPRFSGTTTAQRSHTMSRIRGRDTSIEVRLRKALWNEGIRFRKQYRIKGTRGRTIDIALTGYKIAIYCDSEFFHGKDWETLKEKLGRGNNPEYWIEKIQHNIDRDLQTDTLLRSRGWIVLRFWQEEIDKDLSGCVKTVKENILEQKTKTIF